MRIECVQVCVNYADYLAHTLPFNKYVFDKLVVVTSVNDKATARVCEYYHIHCIKTNLFDNGINKGRAINLGLQHLSRDGWLVQMDADIVLPPRARYLLEIAKLREDTLYGVHRAMCPSYEDWCKFVARPFVNHECDIYIHNHGPFPLGTQIGKLSINEKDWGDLGYLPIGYFQCWYEGGKDKKSYPEDHNNFAGSDAVFGYNWSREKRALIPEITAIHLSTPEQLDMGVNWSGRKSPTFGPVPYDEV